MNHIPTIEKITNLTVYLEGLQVPFNSIEISEAEGTIPSASISFISDSKILRILPGTLVQIYGDVFNEDMSLKINVLLFEGELVGLSYLKDAIGGNQIVAQFQHMFNKLLTAKLLPADSIVSRQDELAATLKPINVSVYTDAPNNTGTGGAQTNADTKEPTKKRQTSFSGNLQELGVISRFTGLSSTFAEALKKNSPASKGSFMPMFEAINSFFKESDLPYGILDKSFKLSESMFIFPNPGIGHALQVKATWESFKELIGNARKLTLGSKETFTLYEVLTKLQTYLNYQFIVPAAPTASSLFYTNLNQKNHYPLRGFYFPRMENGAPILANVFFPKQVTRLSYSRNMVAEITRQVSSMSWPFLQEDKIPRWMKPIYILPSMELVQDPKTMELKCKYTQEESYRGVNLSNTTYDAMMANAIRDSKTELDQIRGKTKTSDSSTTLDPVTSVMRIFALENFLQGRYGTRTVQLSTSWCPYRLIGMPGIFFEPGSPSIVGIVAAISTSIGSDGSAGSSVTLRNCRFVFDEERGEEFSPLNTTDTDGLENYLINDFTTDSITAINENMFKQDFYSFRKIGEDIYTYLTKGTAHSNRKFEQYTDKDEAFEKYKTNLTNTKTFDSDPKIDYSILRFIKKRNSKVVGQVDMIAEVSSKMSGAELEKQYTAELSEAITKLKEDYLKIYKLTEQDKNISIITRYMNSLNWRRLTTRLEYQKFVNLSYDQNNHYRDTKDMFYLLNNIKDTTRATVKANDSNYISEEFRVSSSSQFTKETVKQESSIFKPLNITRRAHIVYAFKEYKKSLMATKDGNKHYVMR